MSCLKRLSSLARITRGGIGRDRPAFVVVKGHPSPPPPPFWIGVMLCIGFVQTRLDSSWSLALSRSSLICTNPVHSITPIQNGGGGGGGWPFTTTKAGRSRPHAPSFPMKNTTVKYLKMTRLLIPFRAMGTRTVQYLPGYYTF